MNTKEAFDILKTSINNDSSYAWSWHCNIAVSFMDEGVDPKLANFGAARFMSLCFNVDVTKFDEWESLFPKPHKDSVDKLAKILKSGEGEFSILDS